MDDSEHGIEIVTKDGIAYCYIVRAHFRPETTTFITEPEHKQQVGFIRYPAGSTIPRHVHLPLERSLIGTSEVVIVLEGSCTLEVYTDDQELIATRNVERGDLILMIAGGHGFDVHDDTVLLEVKQGPYLGLEEKERF